MSDVVINIEKVIVQRSSVFNIMSVAVHRGVMMADTLSFNAKIGVVDF